MSLPVGLQTTPEWKQYLLFGERLLEQPSIEKQCELISQILKDLFKVNARIWLSTPYFPLPGESESALLPDMEAPILVKQAFEKQLQQFEHGDNSPITTFDNPDKPKSVAIPLVSQDNMLGILSVDRLNGSTLKKDEITVLEGLASHAAVAMQIIRQVTIKNWRMDQITLVQKVTEQIANVLDMDELSQRITHLIQTTFNFYYVAIFLVNGKKRTLELRADSSLENQAKLDKNFSVQMGEGIIGFVAKSGRELIANDVTQERLYKKSNLLPKTISEAAFPLKIDKKILGVLDIQSDQARILHEYDISVLRSLANSIAIAVQDASLYSSLRRRADQIEVIFEVSGAINSILDLDELLQKIILTIKKQFEKEDISLYTVHSGRRKIFFQTGVSADNQEILEGEDFNLDNPHGIIPWVARSGISAMINNAADDGRFEESVVGQKLNLSRLVVPLQYANEVLGILDFQNEAADAFDENDLFIVEALASSISTALRNANLFRSEQWRHQVADSFRNVIGMISANTALDTLLENIFTQLKNNLPCDAATIWLVENPNETLKKFRPESLRLAATWNVDKENLLAILRDNPESWKVLETVIRENTPIIRSTNWKPGPIGIALNLPPDYSSISVPLKIGDSIFGILSLVHHTAHRYGPEAKDMAVTFANYAAIAIYNTRLYADSQEQAWISTVLLQVAQTCQASSTPEDLLQSMARLTPLMVGVQKCAFFLWDSFDEIFTFKAQYGFESNFRPQWSKDVPALYQLVETKKPVFVQQPGEELQIHNLEVNPLDNTFVVLPLLVRGEILGAFLVIHEGNSKANSKFSSQTLSILQGISQQTAISLDNMRLLEARQEEAYITAVLLQVAQAVVTQNTIIDTLDTIVNLLPILIGVDLCAIYLPNPEENSFSLAKAYTENSEDFEILQEENDAIKLPILEFVANTNQIAVGYLTEETIFPHTWVNIQPHPLLDRETIAIEKHMLIAFPIMIKNEILGILLTREDDLPSKYFSKRIELLTGVSQEIALAIQNHNLQLENVKREKLEQEIQLARQIQKTFLPDHIPEIKGWDLQTVWETALQVGGDFYDIIPISSSIIALVVADVADKGLAASLYMTVSRTLIRAFSQTMSDPGSVFKSVNNLLNMDAPGGLFVTAILAFLNIETGKIIYANAGHNLPLLYQAKTDDLMTIPRGDMALGVVKDNIYHNQELQMEPEDILILYTDGLTETFSEEGEIFGTDRLRQMVFNCSKDHLSDLMKYFEEQISAFRENGPPSDDLTIVSLKRLKRD
ncbi:MAG: hypothetical protein BGO78_00440 [Chloroflexi bacterium 44-23]|nr:MAG: hypothetical protein BGO78_00440 [Chloroflexi bacterium 44-23]